MERIIPSDFGVTNPKFNKFRPNQIETSLRILGNSKRFSVLNAPPGTGKSLSYAVVMEMLESRSCVLTFTKALQRQLVEDFPHCINIMGIGNYECVKDGGFCDTGSCHLGYDCDHKPDSIGQIETSPICSFYDTVYRARNAKMVVSNYAFWHMGVDMGRFDLLVLDEVHKVVEVMTSMLEVTIDPKELLEYCSKGILLEIPGLDNGVGAWIDWISYTLVEEIKRVRMTMKIKVSVRALRTLRGLKGLLDYLSKDPGNWKITDKDGYGHNNKSRKNKRTKMDKIKFSPVWPGKYLEEILYKGIPKILLVSATVTEDMLQFMGLDNSQCDFMELPSLFAPKNRSFTYVKVDPRIRINYKTSDREVRKLVRRCFDPIIEAREDRKGVIHCRSFHWGKRIIELSRNPEVFMLNTSWNTRDVVREFKSRDPPCVLMSPSVESGSDFLGDQCRYQIIFKVPFIDRRSDVVQERCKAKGYADMLVAQSIIQMVGRSTRSVDDWSEVFIFDLHWEDFYIRRKRLFAKWFREAYLISGSLPRPMRKGA